MSGRTPKERSLTAALLATVPKLLVLWGIANVGYFSTLFSKYLKPILASSSCSSIQPDTTPILYSSLYAKALDWQANQAASQVRMVAIRQEQTDLQLNVCKGREYLAHLVRAVDAAGPSVIVLDKYFDANACLSSPASTDDLIKAVTSATARVVIGESVTTSEQDKQSDCLTLNNELPFEGAQVSHGLIALNVNKEQIPLEWPVLPSGKASFEGESSIQPTLALKAAELAAPELHGWFQTLRKDERSPFAQFSMHPKCALPSLDIVCRHTSADIQADLGLHCPAAIAGKSDMTDLRGKVVVIGSENVSDRQFVVGNHLWGFELQARYINALLTGSYLRNPPFVVIVLLLLTFFAGLNLPFLWNVGKTSRSLSDVSFNYQSIHAFCSATGRLGSPSRKRAWRLLYPPLFVVISTIGFLLAKQLPPFLILITILSCYVHIVLTELNRQLKKKAVPEHSKALTAKA
jgi:CHASE2 domain-containing sensor protein